MTEYAWKDWPEECPECGGALQVFSDYPEDGWACDGDKVRCIDPECGTTGQISADAEECCYAVFLDWGDAECSSPRRLSAMAEQHPITPPPELVQQWLGLPLSEEEERLIIAGQWFADQELKACADWLHNAKNHGFGYDYGKELANRLRAARRPKPQSLKEQSLALIDLIQGNKEAWDTRDLDVVRRALEALPND